MLETNLNIPLLENGDRLTRTEFERRYDRMPNVKKAELIEGVVYMSSPVRITHGTPHAHLMGFISLLNSNTRSYVSRQYHCAS